jgi:hypothetical protein
MKLIYSHIPLTLLLYSSTAVYKTTLPWLLGLQTIPDLREMLLIHYIVSTVCHLADVHVNADNK